MRYGRYPFGLPYPAAPPRQDLVTALQQRMLVLGYTPTPGNIYGEAEQVVVDSYADQLGIDDRSDLNGIIAAVLPVMDSDIEVGGMWKKPAGGTITADPLAISGRGGAGLGLGLLALLAVYLITRRG